MNEENASTECERFIEETRDAPPANLSVKFECFSLFSKYGIGMYESRAFDAGGYKWKMLIYPEGNESENEGCYVSVYFAIAETDSLPVGWEVNAVFAFFVYDHHKNNYLCFRGMTRRLNALVLKCGYSKMISYKALIDPSKGFLVDDCCVFGAEVFVVESQCINECFSLLKSSAAFKREWKITGFSKLEHVWNSEEFVVGNYTWIVEVYSKEKFSFPKGRCISIYLDCIDAEEFGPHQKVKAEVCLRIKDKQNGTHDSFGFNYWFTSSAPNWGFSEFMLVDDMMSKGYLVDDCCFLDVEMCVHAVVRDAP